jgi:ribonuclease J
LGEIGRNCAAIEQAGRIVVFDCGVLFPDSDMPGVDLVLPNLQYLIDRKDQIASVVLSHGHEDHIGAVSYLAREMESPLPVYGSSLTLGLVAMRLEEAGCLDKVRLVEVSDNQRTSVGPFDAQFIPVTHSVPCGFCVAFHTSQGVILHTGDFKLDMTPVDGRTTDLGAIGQLAVEYGIRLLMSDSTNAEEPGHTPSETSVGEVLCRLFQSNPTKRIVTTCFASHVHRVAQIADAAITSGRKIATLGRSMGKNVALARKLGLLNIPDSALIDIDQVAKLDPGRVCVISTGSQGEPMSALTLMSTGASKWLEAGEDDLVIISAHAIPGNEPAVGRVIDGLCRQGAEVVHSGLAHVHASGHACQGELQTMISLADPEFFIPVHGEFRHLAAHARLAQRMGISGDRVLLSEDGDVVELSDEGAGFAGHIRDHYMFVDGIVGGVGDGLLRDRKSLSEDGFVLVVVTLDASSGEVTAGPEMITRGWIVDSAAEPVLAEASRMVVARLEKAAGSGRPGARDLERLRRDIREVVGRLVAEATRRRPMIVPVIMEA